MSYFRNTAPTVNTNAQVQQTLLALTHSPYGDSPLFWNMKQSSTKTDELLKPTNPAAQKAVLASQHKVSPRPAAKIKPKSLHGVLNGSKVKIIHEIRMIKLDGHDSVIWQKHQVVYLNIKLVVTQVN